MVRSRLTPNPFGVYFINACLIPSAHHHRVEFNMVGTCRLVKKLARLHNVSLWFAIVAFVTFDAASAETQNVREISADVIIAGGSTAALAAAIASAESGAQTVLIEPTDWIGGQLTSSGVPCIDEAWHRIISESSGETLLDVAKVARDPQNMPPILRDALRVIGNPGRGWVSRYCYEPKIILKDHFEPIAHRLAPRLLILRETVVKRLTISGRKVIALDAIRRIARPSHRSYSALPSQELEDWYEAEPSFRYAKELIRISGRQSAVFVDATEWGELLALSNRPYLQGVEVREGALAGNDQCGQSIVFGFAQKLNARPTDDPAAFAQASGLGFGKYEGRPDAWQRIWTYRRLLGTGVGPTIGDITLQNWGYEPAAENGGNDFPFGYLFLSRDETAETLDDWKGGVNLQVMAAAESRAFAWHHWFKSQAPTGIAPEQITLDGQTFGTGHGLCKLPYIRDTRRSIGIDNFLLSIDDLVGDGSQKTGTVFPDRIAIGAYPADVHFLVNQEYPSHVQEHRDTLPFYIPFRALTHRDFDNLLVAGKTMAQTFMANSATRLQPIEWSSGTAAGVIAAYMAREEATAMEVLAAIGSVQELVHAKTPIDWSF